MSSSKIYSYLLDIQNKCFEYSESHENDGKKYSRQNTILNITTIIITSSVATLTTSTSALEKGSSGSMAVVVTSSFLLYVSAVLTSVQQFLNFEKLSEKHKLASLKFISLGNNIKKFLAVEELEQQDIKNYFKWATDTYEQILFSSSMDANSNDVGNIEIQHGNKLINPFSPNVNSNIIDINLPEDTNNTDNSESTNIISSMRNNEKMKYELERFNVNSFLKK